MSWSISLSKVEQAKIYGTVGDAAIKQGLGFEKALQVANAVSALAYAVPGDVASISASGHHDENTEGGYLSASIGYSKRAPAIVEPVQDAPKEA
jgi:hypothetical protein